MLARRMGKTRIIAETGAGQHGLATATVCALMDMECIVYMGATDIARQRLNVEKMEMLGARVVPVESGNKTLKDATNEAIRDWCCNPRDTYYIIGSTVGPHPYPEYGGPFPVGDIAGDTPPTAGKGRTRNTGLRHSMCGRGKQRGRGFLPFHKRTFGKTGGCRSRRAGGGYRILRSHDTSGTGRYNTRGAHAGDADRGTDR